MKRQTCVCIAAIFALALLRASHAPAQDTGTETDSESQAAPKTVESISADVF